MASSYKDANPNAGAKSGGKTMKNNDGREMGSAWDGATKGNPPLNAKLTFAPNADAPHLGQRPGAEQ